MIDWTQIEALREDLGDGFDELVEVFLTEVDAGVERLDPAAVPSQIGADLHFLKGAALNLGFIDFAELCSHGEQRASRGETVSTSAIVTCYQQSRAVFLDGLSKRWVA